MLQVLEKGKRPLDWEHTYSGRRSGTQSFTDKMQRAIPEIIEHIYDAAVEPALWPGVMRAIASLVRAETATIKLHDLVENSLAYLALHPDYPLESIDDYNAHWIRNDPFRTKAQRLGPDKVRTESDLAPNEGLDGADIYRDFYVRWGWHHGIAGYILSTSREAALFGVQRSGRNGPFSAEDLEAVGGLTQHLARAVEVNRRLNRADITREMCENAMDLADSGLIVLDVRGRVLFANALADSVLSAHDGLALERQTVRALSAVDRIALESAIAKALSTCQSRSATSCMIQRRSGPPLRLLVTPFGPRGGRRPGALIIITNPDDELTKLAATLTDRHDLTPAEARVAAALCRGFSPAAIASVMKISIHTVRSHLKNIQWKIGVRGQAQIVAELLRGPGFVTRRV